MMAQVKPAIVLALLLTLLTGVIYPLAMTGVSQILFPDRANGSLLTRNGKVIGSELIGQNFSGPAYFRPRPSVAGTGYDATASGGSNLGPTSRVLLDRVDSLTRRLNAENPNVPIPVDMVTTSASGLDPHISPAAAAFQIPRVAHERGISEEEVARIVDRYTEGRQLGFLGEPRVNVLLLNLALDSVE